MICYRDRCYCCPEEPCDAVECDVHILHIHKYRENTPLCDQLPVAMVDFSKTCEGFRAVDSGAKEKNNEKN